MFYVLQVLNALSISLLTDKKGRPVHYDCNSVLILTLQGESLSSEVMLTSSSI